MSNHLALDVVVRAPVEAAFDGLTDWNGQSLWMLGTRVRVTKGDGRSVGSEIEAITGVGRAGIVDTMTITLWDPPHRVDVIHTGHVVRGTGTMEVLQLPHGMSRVVWSEDLDVPLGFVGRAAWPIVRPGFVAGVRRSLRAYAGMVEQGVIPRDPRLAWPT